MWSEVQKITEEIITKEKLKEEEVFTKEKLE
jgi:hypothetical protein